MVFETKCPWEMVVEMGRTQSGTTEEGPSFLLQQCPPYCIRGSKYGKVTAVHFIVFTCYVCPTLGLARRLTVHGPRSRIEYLSHLLSHIVSPQSIDL